MPSRDKSGFLKLILQQCHSFLNLFFGLFQHYFDRNSEERKAEADMRQRVRLERRRTLSHMVCGR